MAKEFSPVTMTRSFGLSQCLVLEGSAVFLCDPMARFQPGDHVREFEGCYWHHAIFVECEASGRARLIHHRGKPLGTIMDEGDQNVSFYELVFRPSDPEAVLRRARSRVGEGGYDLLFQNCEHFANWCCTGIETSAQIVDHSAGTPHVLANAAVKWTSAALNLRNIDATPLEAIRGVAGEVFTGSVAVAGLASVARASHTAQGLEGLVRLANQFSVWGISSQILMPTGLRRHFGCDLLATLASGRDIAIGITPGSSNVEVTVPRASNAMLQEVSGSEKAFQAATFLRYPAMALELGGHLYNICNAPEKGKAIAKALGSSCGQRLGACAGAAIGSLCGPFAPVASGVLSVLGGLVGALAGNWFASRCAEGAMGGVDLGSTLHFADQLPVLDGVMLDPVSGFVAAASQGHKDGSQGHFAQLSMHDVAVILKVEFFNQGRAEFSLDAFDPLEPFGEFQKKVFRPQFLAGTDVGELLFRADVLLKRLSLGLEVPNLPGWRSPLDFGETIHDKHRLWIVPLEAHPQVVKDSADPSLNFVLPGKVTLAVLACALNVDPNSETGLVDCPVTDPQDPACLMALQCSVRMDELIEYYPTLKRLHGVYQTLTMFRMMKQMGATVDYSWVELFAGPLFETPGKFSTLTNSFTTRNWQSISTRTLVGGCVLGDPDMKVTPVEVQAESGDLKELFNLARLRQVSRIPASYCMGRRLDDSTQPPNLCKLSAKLEQGGSVLVDLPRPLPTRETQLVLMPFAKHEGFECAACHRPLLADPSGPDGIRYQTVLGKPLCSRLHHLDGDLIGPAFRLTPPQRCAACGEDLRSDIFMVRSTEEAQLDYHIGCAPADAVQRHFDNREEEAAAFEQLLGRLNQPELQGQRLGGLTSMPGARVALLNSLSSGNGFVDVQQAIQASLEPEGSPHFDSMSDEAQISKDAELALALQESMLAADGFSAQDIALALQRSAHTG